MAPGRIMRLQTMIKIQQQKIISSCHHDPEFCLNFFPLQTSLKVVKKLIIAQHQQAKTS
jgi:hypothetical protein